MIVVVAYGKFGGIELGYGSDLDLVFLHDSARRRAAHRRARRWWRTACSSCGSCSASVHLLTVHSAAGRLYEVDTRLRPSGKGGLLVQSIDGFRRLPAHRRLDLGAPGAAARARGRRPARRCVRGSRRCASTCCATQCGATRCARTCAACASACARNSRSRVRGEFDLKQDSRRHRRHRVPGAVLGAALGRRATPSSSTYSDNIRQLESLASIDLVPQATVDVLTGAYRAYRQRIHHLSLERREQRRARGGVRRERADVEAIWRPRWS